MRSLADTAEPNGRGLCQRRTPINSKMIRIRTTTPIPMYITPPSQAVK
jgi:hypothetical protein